MLNAVYAVPCCIFATRTHRLPFKDTESLEASSGTGFTMRVTSVTKMKANMEEVPYVFEKGQVRGHMHMYTRIQVKTHKHGAGAVGTGGPHTHDR